MLNLEAIAKAPIKSEPVNFFVAPGVLSAVDLAAVRADFPLISQGGPISVSKLIYGPAFADLIAELQAPDFRTVIEEKYPIDLSDRTAAISVCGWLRSEADQIRPGHRDGYVTCLLYLNNICDDRGGRLRLPRGSKGQSASDAEVPLSGGMLASYLNPDTTQFGRHEPHNGELRCLSLIWAARRADRGCVGCRNRQCERIEINSA